LPNRETETCRIGKAILAESGSSLDTKPLVLKKDKTILKKDIYGIFQNVLLTKEEHQKLINQFGEDSTKELIETLSRGIESKGYKYKNHYATILTWDRNEKKRNPQPSRESRYTVKEGE
jgi:hypothetical protein